MKTITLELTAEGGIAMLHADEVDLRDFGAVAITRASHVEADSNGDWYVQSAKTGAMIAVGFKTRAEALAFEKDHYSPGGAGWNELTERKGVA